MSKADKMLEELGYRKVSYLVKSSIDLGNKICYEKNYGMAYLIFNFDIDKFTFGKVSENFLPCYCTMQELQAINEKCKELRMDIEKWKDIKDYEGLYQISNLGNVRSLITNKILKSYKNKNGYIYIEYITEY